MTINITYMDRDIIQFLDDTYNNIEWLELKPFFMHININYIIIYNTQSYISDISILM